MIRERSDIDRLMVFLDAEYIVQKMRELKGARKTIRRRDIRWDNMVKWITGRAKLIRCYYYSSEFSKEENQQTYQEQQEYFLNLKSTIAYFDIRMGRLVHVNSGWVQKGVDIKIALDMYSKAASNQYDIAAIVTGDSDFADVITEVKERYGKHVELYTFDRTIHDALRMTPDKHIVITAATGRKNNFWVV
jgi:uncharacterized LabA/DUF88 family protein